MAEENFPTANETAEDLGVQARNGGEYTKEEYEED